MDGSVTLAPTLKTTLSSADYPRSLNLGSGNRPIAGHLNVDCSARVNPDLVLDLNARPWKLPENYFSLVRMHDVAEHLADLRATLDEIHRIGQNGAKVDISVPHFSSANAFADPDHRYFFAHNSLNFCAEPQQKNKFTIDSVTIHFERYFGARLARWYANRHPAWYEKRWAWTFPANFLSYQLTVVK